MARSGLGPDIVCGGSSAEAERGPHRQRDVADLYRGTEPVESRFRFRIRRAQGGQGIHPVGQGFYRLYRRLEAHRVSGDQPAKVLEVTAEGDSDYLVRYFFAMVNGQLKQVGKVKGQGDLKVPGNGTLIATDWMGFWMKTEKYVFGKDLTLTQIPQEFYSLAIEETSGIEGTVVTSFPVYQTRDGKTVLANTRKGSKFRVLLWDPHQRSPAMTSSSWGTNGI